MTPNFPENNYTNKDEIRPLLEEARLSQRAAAKYLQVDSRSMRAWCSEGGKPPAPVLKALNFRNAYAEGLKQIIAANERTIKAIEEGRISSIGGRDADEIATNLVAEVERLKKLNEEHNALLQMDQAFHRRQQACLRMNEQWLPQGSGAPTEESLAEFDAADEAFKEAQAACERIIDNIRSRKTGSSQTAESKVR